MYWTQNLDLNEHLNVNVIDDNGTEHHIKMNYGDSLNTLEVVEECINDKHCEVIDRQTNKTYDPPYIVWRELELLIQRSQSVSSSEPSSEPSSETRTKAGSKSGWSSSLESSSESESESRTILLVIELYPIEASEVNTTELEQKISKSCGIRENRLCIKVETNDQGQVVRITVFMEDEDVACFLADEINRMAKTCESAGSGEHG